MAAALTSISLVLSLFSLGALYQAILFSPLLLADPMAPSVVESTPSAPPRGVNLGGWLVLEPWITPSIFYPFLCPKAGCSSGLPPVIDQASFCERLGGVEARSQLREHHDTWVTESTFAKIREMGLSFVRIPYGYWLFGDMDVCPGVSQIEYLDRAIDWAEYYGIEVLLDLHGVKGGANGLDNDGVSHRKPFASAWGRPPFDGSAWLRPENWAVTEGVLRRIVARYGHRPAVTRFGLGNEVLLSKTPWCATGCPLHLSQMIDTLGLTWASLSALTGGVPVVDAGLGSSAADWKGKSPSQHGLSTAILDRHEYQAWLLGNPGWLNWLFGISGLPQVVHMRATCFAAEEMTHLRATTGLPVMIGEWSLAITNCMTWLNGVGKDFAPSSICSRVPCPTRYNELVPKTESVGGPDAEGLCPVGKLPQDGAVPMGPHSPDAFYRLLATSMMAAYERGGGGWTWWNFDCEVADPRWSLFEAHRRGWLPSNLSTNATATPIMPCEQGDSFLGDIVAVVIWLAVSFVLLLTCSPLLCCFYPGARIGVARVRTWCRGEKQPTERSIQQHNS
eukprot:CAMPEP_0115833252 /NCGR_PEP_ID=MMETSP0287-20121206/3076_1 /TAXON_ID=412157 /ORGANISM="Chrysochromulina rotalis, Strain UIO044" /LENGTH=561 /DNA_ID=CAMNT_0003286659 /DNA_START=75 /DNA_END=1760 /DNA_ORIENTATION=-